MTKTGGLLNAILHLEELGCGFEMLGPFWSSSTCCHALSELKSGPI